VAITNGTPAAPQPTERPPKKSQAQQIVDSVRDQIESGLVELFHGPGKDDAFASFLVEEHWETWPLRSPAFTRFLRNEFYKQTGGRVASAQGIADAKATLEGLATFEGPERPVHVRIAGNDQRVYLDLCNDAWGCVEVTAAGWRLCERAPVKFVRKNGMLPLPAPVRHGRLDELRKLINVDDDQQWTLIVAWLVAALRPNGPYPVMALHGEQGSGKSTAERAMRRLIDPNKAAIRAEPRDGRDLYIAASNGWVIALDNLSRVEEWLSDGLCRLATGGGFATRLLYTDDNEKIFNAQRPVILNGIEEVVTRADLLDRSLLVRLPSITEERRQPEKDMWQAFEAAHPALLGVLLDGVACALRRLSDISLARLPRMADFAKWATAAAPALGLDAGAFMAAYAGNRAEANELALESDPIVPALRSLLAEGPILEGPTKLLERLSARAGEGVTKSKGWPKSPRALTGKLERLAPNLRAVGIEVVRPERQSKARFWSVCMAVSQPDDGSEVTDDGSMTQTSFASVIENGQSEPEVGPWEPGE
jgi:hypothetical protein